jgi:IclR family KDG regulon transcriptional repressor
MKTVRSVSRAFRILESFPAGESRSISDVSTDIGIPRSTAHEILSTLVQEGALERDGASSRYQLGTRLIELGNRARHNFPLNRIAAPVLQALREVFDETVYLTVLDGDEVYYVDCYESTRVLRTFSSLGDRAPLYCTAVGKAVLAFRGQGAVERYLAAVPLVPFTPRTIVDRDLLLQELRVTAKRGYSVDDMEHEEGVRCVGAPLRNAEGRVFAAISVSGPAQRVSVEREPEIAARVTAAAGEISRRLGYRPPQRTAGDDKEVRVGTGVV